MGKKSIACTFTLKSILITCLVVSSFSASAMGFMARAKLKLTSWRSGQGQHKPLRDDIRKVQLLEQPESPALTVIVGEKTVKLGKKNAGLQETIVFSPPSRSAYGDRAIRAVYTATIGEETDCEKQEYIETLDYLIDVKQYGNMVIGHSCFGKRPVSYAQAHENKQDEQAHEDLTVAQKVQAALVKYKNEIDLL